MPAGTRRDVTVMFCCAAHRQLFLGLDDLLQLGG
jgi:hypothetical protein